MCGSDLRMVRLACRIGAVAWLAGLPNLSAQEGGYVLRGNQVVVNTRQHWQNWESPAGTVEISPTGEVRPRRWRKETNAVADLLDFLRLNPPVALGKKKPEELSLLDAIQAGSNQAGVAAVLDGDMSTYWEPEPPAAGIDLATQWWFTVDLGRFVFAEKIVLSFVDEDLGDPFLLFDVLVSDGIKPSGVSGVAVPEFKSVLRSLQPNKSQRTFEIDLRQADVEVKSEGLRFVQVVVTGSDRDRGREVTPEDYGSLGEADQGAIEHYKRLPDGGEIPVDQDLYEGLPEERRGHIRYYRQERPRLAELEVWTEGDEIVIGSLKRGGFLALPGGEDVNLKSFVDGDLETSSNLIIHTAQVVANPERSLFFDLASSFWVDTQRMAWGRGNYRGSFADYRLDFSDGSLAPDGSLKWTRVVDRRQTQTQGVRFEGNAFDPIKARFFRVQYTLGASPGLGGLAIATLAEIQLYGAGYQPEVTLESDLIRLGGSRSLLSIVWDADTPPGTGVEIQTRTGDKLGEVLHYFKKDGTEVTEDQYKKLLSVFKGEKIAEEVPGSDWSDWSEPYADPAGSLITSPSPREYLKVRVILRSEDPGASAAIRSLRLNFADPVAQGLVGEISPSQADTLGKEQAFSLYIRPRFARGDPGFDELLLVAPPDMKLEYAGLYHGTEAQMTGVEGVERIPSAGDSLHLGFPLIGPAAAELVRLDFRTALYSTGAVLHAALQRRGSGTGAWQRVDPGDASPAVASNSTTLVGPFHSDALIEEVEVEPPVFTPNGDGINEEAVFRFRVVRIGDNSPVQVRLYDLGGRLVRALSEQRSLSAGAYAIAWDGRDGEDRLAPPGVYYARLSIDTEVEGARIGRRDVLKIVSLAY